MEPGFDLTGNPSTLQSPRPPASPNHLEPTSDVLISYFVSNVLSQSAASEPAAATHPHLDFISFLAIAQKLEIDLLSVTWQPALESIGEGATAEIRQSLISLQTTFAFKRIRPSTSSQEAKRRAFQALVTEISILGLPEIRRHPNIVRIEGICWDVLKEEEEEEEDVVVWPVLVFEKSQYGDLDQFMRAAEGRAMNLEDRLQLCSGIASAVAEMHFHDVIHGDIKPKNILVFKDDQNSFVPRVTDFGYSTKIVDRDSVFLPKSRPWAAPEHHHRSFTFYEAKRCDVYSFGLVCLWILFQDKLSEAFPTFLGIHDRLDASSSQYGQKASATELKDEEKLLSFSKNAVITAVGLDSQQKAKLMQLFDTALVRDPNLRCDNFGLLEMLLWQIRNLPPAAIIETKELGLTAPHADFQIPKSLLFLVDAHYLVRRHIKTCLESLYDSSSCEKCVLNAAFQLAICYDIGFGVSRCKERSLHWLKKSGSNISNLEAEKRKARRPQWQYNSEPLRRLDQGGHLRAIDYVAEYQKTGRLKGAQTECQREINDTMEGLGANNITTKRLKLQLAEILEAQGDFKGAEDILVQLSGKNEPDHEDDDDGFLDIQNRLAISLHRQGKSEAAAEILERDIRKKQEIHEKGNRSILSSMTTLSWVYSHQGKFKASEELQRQALEGYEVLLGPEHPEVLTMIGNLAQVLVDQGKHLEAKEMQIRVLKGREKMLGMEHQDTLTALSNLAESLSLQRNYKEAEEINRRVLKKREQLLGKEHLDTLVSMGNLATTLAHLGQYEAAKDMHRETLEGRATILGNDNPVTLVSMAGLADALNSLGKYEEGEALSQQTFQISEKVLGIKHRDTLNRANSLASVLQRLGKNEEAKQIHERALEGATEFWGDAHPMTLSIANNLALDNQSLGQYRDAEELYLEILEKSKDNLGSTHPVTLAIMNNLADVLRVQRKFEEAEIINRLVLESTETILGNSHHTTLTAVQNLAGSLHAQGRHVEAVPFYMRACGGLRSVLGNEHPQTIECFRNYLGMLSVMTEEEIHDSS